MRYRRELLAGVLGVALGVAGCCCWGDSYRKTTISGWGLQVEFEVDPSKGTAKTPSETDMLAGVEPADKE